jgi:8-oxo-dGTP pyrophosphatase MutT (NUDIX family)
MSESSEPEDAIPVRHAATVVLLRDGSDGIEAWLLSRVARMAFAPSVTVFPGGEVDASDGELPWSGADPAPVEHAFGCSPPMARALVGAAVREVFEETGVLLSVPAAELSASQPDVEAGRITFGGLLVQHGLSIDAGAVHPWAHWITPVGETSRRYDTRFFVAALPTGAVAADLTSESVTAQWSPLRRVLQERADGLWPMLPPTISVTASLAEFDTVADVLASVATRVVSTITPIMRTIDGQRAVELPDGSTMVL